ncbi:MULTISPECIES: hypothetical protein [Nostocales]|uniref:Transposase n=1 Tax=Tolypothrix campylonemoides VB511288_2 TaxID=3232311 RepID=A0ABW8XNA5_9CYAN
MPKKHSRCSTRAKIQGKFHLLQCEEQLKDLVKVQATCSEFGIAVTFEEVSQ